MKYVTLLLAVFFLAPAFAEDFTPERDYRFDGSISRQVLENYLDRSISYTELLHDDLSQPRNNRGVDPHDNLRFILNTGAKFVGRALMCWGRERELDTLLRNAKTFAAELHKADPDIVLQGAAFEIVTRGVESVAIPEYVFKEFGLPVVKRNFVFADISYPTGTHRMGMREQGRMKLGEPVMMKLPATTSVFNVPSQLIRILDRDLAAAGIAKRDDRNRTVDVHGMRHTFCSHLAKAGVSLRTAQACMRHSKPELTANAYTDPRLLDVAGAMEALPTLSLDITVATTQSAMATGTDFASVPNS